MNPPHDARTRQLLVVSLCLFGIAGLIFGTVFVRANLGNGRTTRQRAGKPRWGQIASASELNKTLAYTQVLREKWRPWATEHQQMLRRWMHEQNDNPEALQEFCASAPAPPLYKGAGFALRELSHEGISFASWTGGQEFAPTKEDGPLAERRYKKSLLLQDEFQQRNYKMYRDIAVLTSMTSGPTYYTFWASGRITESTNSLDSRQHGQNSFVVAKEKEVVPPFEFLR